MSDSTEITTFSLTDRLYLLSVLKRADVAFSNEDSLGELRSLYELYHFVADKVRT